MFKDLIGKEKKESRPTKDQIIDAMKKNIEEKEILIKKLVDEIYEKDQIIDSLKNGSSPITDPDADTEEIDLQDLMDELNDLIGDDPDNVP